MNSTEEEIMKSQVMIAAFNWFSNVLTVFPLQDKLIMTLSDCNNIKIPSSHKTEGIAADYILYISGNRSGNQFIARGGACAYQVNGANNVIAGSFEVNLDLFFGLSLADQIIVAIHEITHALVFSSELFDFFKKPDGNPYLPEEILKDIYYPNRDKWVLAIVLPTVLAKAQESFDCPSLRGVDLEDFGGDGTVGSH